MRRIGAFEAKTHLSQLLAEVEHRHEEIIIQKRGRDVAILKAAAPAAAENAARRPRGALEAFREIRSAARVDRKRSRLKDLVNEGRKR